MKKIAKIRIVLYINKDYDLEFDSNSSTAQKELNAQLEAYRQDPEKLIDEIKDDLAMSIQIYGALRPE